MNDPNPDPNAADDAVRLLRAAAGRPHDRAADEASLDAIRAAFPELRIERLIGEGGMATVYRAEQPNLRRTVALKILKPELAAQPEFRARFAREARALASLDHPRILRVLDFGERSGVFFLLTDFVDGADLRDLLELGQLSPEEALRLVPEICEALRYAHLHGVVHRDIKPENILIDLDGHVRIADFGLARIARGDDAAEHLTRATQVLGTPHYMAPEQWRAGEVDHRADIYSLGVVLYEMLTGKLPLGDFAAPSERPDVPEHMDAVVRRALAQDPERRYQQVEDFERDLDHHRSATQDRARRGPNLASQPAQLTTSLFVQVTVSLGALGTAAFGTLAMVGWLIQRLQGEDSWGVIDLYWLGVVLLTLATVAACVMTFALRTSARRDLRELAALTVFAAPVVLSIVLAIGALAQAPEFAAQPWKLVLIGLGMTALGIWLVRWRVRRAGQATPTAAGPAADA